MRTWLEGIVSSLVTRLTLAVLAVLVLSLSVTAAVFIAQLHLDDSNAAAHAVSQPQTILAVRTKVFQSILNSPETAPLAHVNIASIQPIDRVLLTVWPNDRVVGDTSYGGGPSPLANWNINYRGRTQSSGAKTLNGIDYAFLALAPNDLPARPNASYRSIILLERITPLQDRAWLVIGRLARAAAIAILVSLLAAVIALRRLTRPLHGMTLASERMAAGDYDQRVTGADSPDEVGQLARSFNHMAQEVNRVREMQRQFIANVSHDLRSPLTSIIGFSQALTEDPAITPTQRRSAEIINNEAERLSRLTMDLLDLSRLEAGRLPLSKQPLDLNVLLHEVAERYQALPHRRGVHFAAQLGDNPLPVIGDLDRLTQIVVNLLDNAFKFSATDGDVRLASARRDGEAIVEIYNTGPGIAPDDLPRVFDRFYRGDHSRAQRTGGSGIGLAIVRELVHAHGGTVTPSSEVGAWTLMTVRLPLASTDVFTKDLQAANTEATTATV